jgi:biopolymer transport protein ExbD
MAISASGKTGLTNEPNVTPMIDVLLVLLIVFMVWVPQVRKSVDLQVPTPNPPRSSAPPPDQIVLEVLPNEQFAINKQPATRETLSAELHKVYDGRPSKVLFVKGDPKVKYQDVIWAMDQARGAGVKVIGVPPKEASPPGT